MKYEKIWNKALAPDEKIEYEFSMGGRYLNITLLLLTILVLPFLFFESNSALLLLLLVWFYFGFYAERANAYALSNRRILVHRGWLSSNLTSVDYAKITDINVGEPFIERILFNTGYITINTAGTSQEEIVLDHIEAPYEIKKKIDILKDKK